MKKIYSLDERLLKEHRTYYQTRKKTHKKRINKLFETRDELVESLNAVRDKKLVRSGKELDWLKRNEGKLFTRMGRAGDNEKKIARIQT